MKEVGFERMLKEGRMWRKGKGSLVVVVRCRSYWFWIEF